MPLRLNRMTLRTLTRRRVPSAASVAITRLRAKPLKRSERRASTLGAAAALIAAGLGGCASGNYRVPDEAPPSLQKEPALIETGSRIPRGKEQPVRDTTQNVDVYSEEELEADRPVDTPDAVRRAVIGR